MENFINKLENTKAELSVQLARVIDNLFLNHKVAAATIEMSPSVLKRMLDGNGNYTLDKYFEVFYKLGQDISIIGDSRDYQMTQEDMKKCRMSGGYYTISSITSPSHFFKR